MLGSIYVGLAGMSAYAKGLDVISNNVANLSTSGFRFSVASFGNLVQRNSGATAGSGGSGAKGAGVEMSGEFVSFNQGDRPSTGNSLNAAVLGSGFFVLEKDGQRFYSRAGNFDRDTDGNFADQVSGAMVMMRSESGGIGALNFDAHMTNPPKATTELKLTGTIVRTGIQQAGPFTFDVFDSGGNKQQVRVTLVRDETDPLLWTVEVRSAVATDKLLGSGTLKFKEDGTPADGNVAITATVEPDKLPPFTFALNFGDAGSFLGVTCLTTSALSTSNVTMLRQDGLEFGTFRSASFDERGKLEFTYSNGEKKSLGRLVLARFDSGSELRSVGNGMYVAEPGREPQLYSGMEEGLGQIEGGRIESSNVDLNQQFTTLIIIQRGYQACSQMTSVANEMMQQLLAMQNGK